MKRAPSGRPTDGEFATYAKIDIDFVVGGDIIATLRHQAIETTSFLSSVNERFASTFHYAPGKWTVKQVLGHLIDDERIFAYRILCVARNDSTPLPGFDQDEYVASASFESQSLPNLLMEYRATRRATLSLLSSFTPEEWLRSGVVNGYVATPRGLSFHIAGHELHHLRVLHEKYISSTPSA